jgi:hypothetical protein
MMMVVLEHISARCNDSGVDLTDDEAREKPTAAEG